MAHLVAHNGRRGGLLAQRSGGKAQGEGGDLKVPLVHQAGRLLQGCRQAGGSGGETEAAMEASAGVLGAAAATVKSKQALAH